MHFLDHCIKELSIARGRRLYRFCASRDSESDDTLLGAIAEEKCGQGDRAKVAPICNGIEPIVDGFDLSKRSYDRVDKVVSTVVAQLVADGADLLHELAAEPSAREIRLGVVGVVDGVDCLEASSKRRSFNTSSSQRSTNGIRSGLDRTRSRCRALSQQLDLIYSSICFTRVSSGSLSVMIRWSSMARLLSERSFLHRRSGRSALTKYIHCFCVFGSRSEKLTKKSTPGSEIGISKWRGCSQNAIGGTNELNRD